MDVPKELSFDGILVSRAERTELGVIPWQPRPAARLGCWRSVHDVIIIGTATRTVQLSAYKRGSVATDSQEETLVGCTQTPPVTGGGAPASGN